ncbi:hypothetical protein NDU88_007583 [Pleurodeles waltl]|uniref:Uncharacterized protein n=1 Tax=Pleurodeles waltl TaxID=8319 RepID=A0AAV7VT34_PLEWA|nr:hypothetical protein NDU88_007583 [Pleurodeles waltl]
MAPSRPSPCTRRTRVNSLAPASICPVSEQGTSGYTTVVSSSNAVAEVRTKKCFPHHRCTAKALRSLRGHHFWAAPATARGSPQLRAPQGLAPHPPPPAGPRSVQETQDARYALQQRVREPGPGRYSIQRQSSSDTLLLGGHLGHAPVSPCLKGFYTSNSPSNSALLLVCFCLQDVIIDAQRTTLVRC